MKDLTWDNRLGTWGSVRVGAYLFLAQSFNHWPDGDLTINLFVAPDGEEAFFLESFPYEHQIEEKIKAYHFRLTMDGTKG